MTEMHRPALLYCTLKQALFKPTTQPVSEHVSRSVTTTQGSKRVTPVTVISALQGSSLLSSGHLCMHAYQET